MLAITTHSLQNGISHHYFCTKWPLLASNTHTVTAPVYKGFRMAVKMHRNNGNSLLGSLVWWTMLALKEMYLLSCWSQVSRSGLGSLGMQVYPFYHKCSVARQQRAKTSKSIFKKRDASLFFDLFFSFCPLRGPAVTSNPNPGKSFGDEVIWILDIFGTLTQKQKNSIQEKAASQKLQVMDSIIMQSFRPFARVSAGPE